MSDLNSTEINAAFKIRLSEINPMKHVEQAYSLVKSTSFNNDVITKWRRIIKELVKDEEDRLENQHTPSGLHPLIAGFPTGFFAYLFDPDKYEAYLENNEIQTIVLPTNRLVKYVDQQQLDPMHGFENYIENTKIIVLESSLFNQPFCINGNLNIVEANKKRHKNLNVYYLLTDEYLHLMFDNLSKGMHMFHSDLQRLIGNQPPKFDNLYLSKINAYLT